LAITTVQGTDDARFLRRLRSIADSETGDFEVEAYYPVNRQKIIEFLRRVCTAEVQLADAQWDRLADYAVAVGRVAVWGQGYESSAIGDRLAALVILGDLATKFAISVQRQQSSVTMFWDNVARGRHDQTLDELHRRSAENEKDHLTVVGHLYEILAAQASYPDDRVRWCALYGLYQLADPRTPALIRDLEATFTSPGMRDFADDCAGWADAT
jgi:hypothetical protein